MEELLIGSKGDHDQREEGDGACLCEGCKDGMDSTEKGSGEAENTFEHLVAEYACTFHPFLLV